MDGQFGSDQNQVPTYIFDPDASPQQKAAIPAQRIDQLNSIVPPNRTREPLQHEITMLGANTPPAIPTIVIEHVGDPEQVKPNPYINGEEKKVKPFEKEEAPLPEQDSLQSSAFVPGAMPATVIPAIPDWYKVGWRQVSGIDLPPLPHGDEKDKTILDTFLAEQFYGAWYHNAAVIVVAVLITHFLSRFNFGWGWLFIVLAFCCTYYTTSIERFRRSARDDIQRELVKTKIGSEHESAEWINNFLDRFWKIYEPVLSTTIVSSVTQILATSTPGFVESMALTTFTLGNKAPRIDKVRTFPKTEEDIVLMDWGISFTPRDTSDMTKRQIDSQAKPKIVLSVRLGKGIATAALPILVEDFSFSGLMRIRMRLMANFPHIQIVDICFMEPPDIGYVLKPVGGETLGFDIANVPGLSSFIRDMTHSTLGGMMYHPNLFTLNLENMLSGKPIDAAIGVVEVVVRSARGIKAVKLGGGNPDPYVSLSFNKRAELACTRYKNSTYNPTWMETKHILVNSLKDVLDLNLYDHNDHLKDNLLGTVNFNFENLEKDASHEGIVAPILRDGKDHGELRFDVNYYPVIEPEQGKEEILNSTVGIVRLTIHQAKDLDHSISMTGALNPIAKVYLNTQPTCEFSTPIFKHTNNPIFESSYEYLCTNKNSASVSIRIVDDRDFLTDPTVGYLTVQLTDLMEAQGEAGRDWFPLSDCASGKVRLSAEWKPLSMAGSLAGSEQYKPPIGIVRLAIEKAMDVKNVEGTLGGKSDPYVRVQVQNVIKGKTEVVNNNLNPVWNQIIYIPVHSLLETMMLECMDYQHLTKDRSLGTVELAVSDIAAKSPEDPQFPYCSKGAKTAAEKLHQDVGNTLRGVLYFTAEFIPSLNLKFNKFESESNQAKQLEQHQCHSEGGNVRTPSSDEWLAPRAIEQKKPEQMKPADKKSSLDSNNNPRESLDRVAVNSHTSFNKDDSEEQGVVLSTEELLSNQSGIVVFYIVSGKLSRKARLEVLLDEGYWPCFSTLKSRSTNAEWGYIGEGFVKEIQFSRYTLRLNEAEDEKEDIIGECSGFINDFLSLTLEGPHIFSLTDASDQNNSTVLVEARYIPVPVSLEPRETVNNQGRFRVDLFDGHDIRAVDRGGKSDPYVVFFLNGKEVYRSETKKKTLSPEWNESFEVIVHSRYGSEFMVDLFDWNQFEPDKSLGVGHIDLNELPPFESQERVINLNTSKHGEKGGIRVRLLFTPEIIAKTRKNTSTFSSAGRAMTQIGILPTSAGKGVFHGVTGAFKKAGGGHAHGASDRMLEEPDLPADVAPPPPPPSQTARQKTITNENKQINTAVFPTGTAGESTVPSNEPGALYVTVVDAKQLSQHDTKPYVTLRLGDKEVKTKHTAKTFAPEWNERFLFAASPSTPKLVLTVFDYHTIGKDKEIGEAEINIWNFVRPEVKSNGDTNVQLGQGGQVRLRLEFNPTLPTDRNSVHSRHRNLSLNSMFHRHSTSKHHDEDS